VFATAEDARALKEIYPGGASEAKAAAERARTLDEIDAAFYRGDGAARAALAQRMMEQDPAAFREMVEAGVRLLGAAGGRKEEGARQDLVNLPRSLHSAPQETRPSGRDDKSLVGVAVETLTPEGVSYRDGVGNRNNTGSGEQTGSRNDAGGRDRNGAESVAPEVVSGYGAFEKAANLELEKSVGGAIARMMEQALPNLRRMGANERDAAQGAVPLQERLAGAVREEVEAALKSDGQLGEQVAKILGGAAIR